MNWLIVLIDKFCVSARGKFSFNELTRQCVSLLAILSKYCGQVGNSIIHSKDLNLTPRSRQGITKLITRNILYYCLHFLLPRLVEAVSYNFRQHTLVNIILFFTQVNI